MKKESSVYLKEILDLISNIEKFKEDMNETSFLKDHKTISACLLEIMIIGENAKKINEDVKNKIELPWREIAGFRDKAVHDYTQIDNEIVSKIVFEKLSDVKKRIKKYLKENPARVL
jgi:uncharacterized protein with HEPN domain